MARAARGVAGGGALALPVALEHPARRHAAILSDALYFRAVAIPGADISLVSVFRRTSSVVSFLVGGLLFRDLALRRKALALLLVLAGPATGAVRFIRRVPGRPKLRGISFRHRHSGKFEWCDQTLSEREGRNRAGRCVIARRSAAMTRSACALSMCQNHWTEMAACEIAAKCAVPVHHVPNCLARAAGRGGESSLRAFNAGGAVFTAFNVHLGGGDIEDFERRCADIETGKAFNVGGAVFPAVPFASNRLCASHAPSVDSRQEALEWQSQSNRSFHGDSSAPSAAPLEATR